MPSEKLLVGYFPHYTSTYCMHDVHEECRKFCKLCAGLCRCSCHYWNDSSELIDPEEESRVPELMAALEESVRAAREARKRHPQPVVEPDSAANRPHPYPIPTSFRGSENESSTNTIPISPDLTSTYFVRLSDRGVLHAATYEGDGRWRPACRLSPVPSAWTYTDSPRGEKNLCLNPACKAIIGAAHED